MTVEDYIPMKSVREALQMALEEIYQWRTNNAPGEVDKRLISYAEANICTADVIIQGRIDAIPPF